jgi:hypothetical protein
MSRSSPDALPSPQLDGGMRQATKDQSLREGNSKAVALLVLILFFVCAGLSWWNPYDVESDQMNWSMAIGFCGCIPLIRRLSIKNLPHFPVFEFHIFFFAIAFGFAGISHYDLLSANASDISDYDLWLSRFCFFLYFGSSIVSFYAASRIQFFRHVRIDQCGWVPDVWSVVVAGGVLLIVNNLNFVPGFLRQIFIAIEYFIVALAMWYTCKVNQTWVLKALSGVYLALKGSLVLQSGLLAQLILLGGAFCCAWIFFRGRNQPLRQLQIPLLVTCFGLLGLIAINPMKHAYRQLTWTDSEMPLAEKFAAMKLTYENVAPQFMDKEYVMDSVEGICSRFSMVPVLSVAISKTPDFIPYKNGITILPFFVKWIPRAIWEDKPSETIGNDWGREYGLLEETNYTTSQNLPLIVEGYINRGILGVLAMGAFVGLVFQVFVQLFERRAVTPVQKVAILSCMMPLFYPESNFSNTFGGVIISLVVILVVLKLSRNAI